MEEKEISIGDICKVADTGCVYRVENQFTIRNTEFQYEHPDLMAKNYITNENCNTVRGKAVRVLDIGPDKRQREILLAIVETIDDPEYMKFLIRLGGGLKFVNDDGKSLKEYLAGELANEEISGIVASEALIDAIIDKNPLDLQYIKTKLLTDDHYKRVLLKDGGLLGLIPIKRRSLELCQVAITEEVYAERFIPRKIKSLVKS